MHVLRSARIGIVVATASALVAAPLLLPTSASASVSASVPASVSASVSAGRAAAAVQSITIKIAKKAIHVRGARGLHAGRVQLDVKGAGVAEILMLERGYEFADFRKDVAAVDKGDMKALRRAIARTTFLGGVASGGSGTIMLPRAGDYTVFSFASRGSAVLRAGSVKRSPAPHVDGTIVGKSGPAWGGSSTLPAQGTFLFKNADRSAPHFVILQQVAEGTTVDQVLDALRSEEPGPPPEFFLPGTLETASLSFGKKMSVDYDLPPGQYAVLCFFPDPRMHGMPHALMGMIKMITLT